MQKQFLALFKKIKEANENAIISPFGLELLLGLLAAGTKGDTQQELYKILELPSKSAILDHIIKRLATIEEISRSSRFDSTNTISYYSPLVRPVKSYNENLPSNLNLTLKPMLGYKDEVAFIVENILHLKALWEQKFETVPHKTEFFTLANGEEVETLFINQSNVYGKNKTFYLKEDDFHAIQIPLKGDRLCVEIYLPYQKDGLGNFVETLKSSDLVEWGKAFQTADRMDTYLPKFEVKSNLDFSIALKELEVTKLFQASWDFKPMLSSEYTLLIKKITQNNTFKLNEHGIEASSTSRGYGGITGTRSIDKFVLFEATHPFLYLVRDKPTNTILFIGIFEAPDKQQNFSLSYYNTAELNKFNKETPFSYRLCFVLTAYALESFITHFNFDNNFINDYTRRIWDLAAIDNELVFKEELAKLEALKWPVSYEEMRMNTKLPKDKNHIKNTPGQIKTIFYEFQETLDRLLYSSSSINFAGEMIMFNLFILNTINYQIPTWENCQKYRKLNNNPWGNKILKNDFLSFLNQPIPELSLTNNQIYERKQNKIIRNLQPLLFDITVRGQLYIGLIYLDKLIAKESVCPIELKEWLLDLVDFISNENSTKFDKLVLLKFDLFRHTGFFDENEYFSKEALDDLKVKYPNLITILASLDGIISTYKFLKDGYSNFSGGSFKYILDILKALIKYKIELPTQSLFEQFPIKDEDILGTPIKLEKKLLKNYYKIIK